MKLKLVGLVANSKVAPSDAVPSGFKRHLVPGEPALKAHNRGTVHRRAVDVVVHITAQVNVLTLEAALDLPAFFATRKTIKTPEELYVHHLTR